MSVARDHAAVQVGTGDQVLVLMHGYGCDQSMWDGMVPLLEDSYRLVLYDLMGCGASRIAAYDEKKYTTLRGHAEDVLALLDDLGIARATLVGHSVSAMIAALAANAHPDRVDRVAMVCPSPSFVNDPPYVGGFERADIDGLLETLDANFVGWSRQMAPAIMGTPGMPANEERLTNSFCRNDPDIARHFARVTFLADHRADVKAMVQPALALHCRDDVIVPDSVGDWMQDNIANLTHVRLDATGHCPHVSYPEATSAALHAHLRTN